MSEKDSFTLDKNLVEFEDSIRMEAMPLNEAFELKKKSGKEGYVVGAGIAEYLNELNALGFKDLWKELEEKEDESGEVVKLFKKYVKEGQEASNALLMYSYID